MRSVEDMSSAPPAWKFRMMQNAHRAAACATLARCGVSEYGQPFILFTLLHSGEDGALDAQRDLADRLRVTPATITASLNSLEKQGCIIRVPDENDMRRKRIVLTGKGREAAASCGRAFSELDDAMYAGFTPEELETLSGFLMRITENLRAICGEGECGCK